MVSKFEYQNIPIDASISKQQISNAVGLCVLYHWCISVALVFFPAFRSFVYYTSLG